MANQDLLEILTSTVQQKDFKYPSHISKWLFQRFQLCRTQDMGGMVLQCMICPTAVIHYLSCNKRGCPECSGKNQLAWKIKALRRVLNVSHHHITFSIPAVFTMHWLIDKKAVTESIFAAAHLAMEQLSKREGLMFGYSLNFQSHGKGMSYKCHIHCMISDGGMNSQGHWESRASLSTQGLSTIFRQKFIKEMRKRSDPQLLLQVDYLISKTKPRYWSIHQTCHEKHAKNIIAYWAKPMQGMVINPDQTFKYDENNDTITFGENDRGEWHMTTLERTTFVTRFLNHIPYDGAVMVRNYGLYATRHKEELKQMKEELGEQETPEEETEPMYLCPTCHHKMEILEVFYPRQKSWILYRWGYGRDPPKHKSIIFNKTA